MHGVTVRLTRTVLPRWLNSQPFLTPTVCGEEGRFDTAVRAVTHVFGHNWTQPLTGHAKAYLNPEETREPNIHFVESSPFSAGRMSNHSRGDEDEVTNHHQYGRME